MGLQGFEMTQSFDEWYFDAKQHNTDGFTNREFYEAGAASRKAEIDELQTKLKSTKQSANEVIGAMSISIHKRNKENESLNRVVDELQKRIYKVTRGLESIKASSLRPSRHDYDKGWLDCAITVLNDLKGKQND